MLSCYANTTMNRQTIIQHYSHGSYDPPSLAAHTNPCDLLCSFSGLPIYIGFNIGVGKATRDVLPPHGQGKKLSVTIIRGWCFSSLKSSRSGELDLPIMSVTIDLLAYHPAPLCHLIDIQYRDLIFSNTMVAAICVGSLTMKLDAPHTNEKT